MIELKLKCVVHLGKQITENIYFPVVTYMQLLSWTFPLLSTQWIEILEQPVTDDIIWKREFPIGPWDQVCKSSKALSMLVSSIKAIHHHSEKIMSSYHKGKQTCLQSIKCTDPDLPTHMTPFKNEQWQKTIISYV